MFKNVLYIYAYYVKVPGAQFKGVSEETLKYFHIDMYK